MKVFISSILILLWVAFVGMGVFNPMVHAGINYASDEDACHSGSNKSETKDDCCAKFHKEENTKDEPCGTDKEDKKGCCNENNCPRACCHIQVAFSNETDNETNPKLIAAPTHTTHPSPNLPSPFLENSCPPPNGII